MSSSLYAKLAHLGSEIFCEVYNVVFCEMIMIVFNVFFWTMLFNVFLRETCFVVGLLDKLIYPVVF